MVGGMSRWKIESEEWYGNSRTGPDIAEEPRVFP